MNINEYEEKKNKLFQYFDTAGIDKDEAQGYLDAEIEVSKKIGMGEDDSKVRALISTMNYYRKYLDKLGNRVKFICLGASQPTDYGLSKKVREIRSKFISGASEYEKQEMIINGIVDKRGMPLHTKDTTIFEEKHGYPINIEEETSQTLIGVVEDGESGKQFPTLIRVFGKAACDKPKPMYVWAWITGEQSKSDKYPGYVVINTREPMFSVQKEQKRIDFNTYETMLKELFSSIIYSVDEDFSAIEELKSHIFLKDAITLSIDKNSFGWESSIIRKKDQYDTKVEILADIRMPQNISIDFDESLPDTNMYICAIPRGKKQNGRLILEAIGIFVNNPVDREKYKMEDNFMLTEQEEVKNLVSAQRTGQLPSESHDFINSLNDKKDSSFQ